MVQTKNTLTTIAQFIPIIIIFLLLSRFRNVVDFSNTYLGKLIAVLIIIFYASLDKIVGVFVCALIIFYYQMDIVENMLNMENDSEHFSNLEDVKHNHNNSHLDKTLDDYIYSSKEETMNYSNLDEEKDILIKNEKKKDKFRKESCVNGQLMNKGSKVNYQITEKVFPEIKFRRGACNPCLKKCEFSVIEKKMKTEEKLRRK